MEQTDYRSEKDETVAANRVQVLIVGVPGRMQESLHTLLKAVPELEVSRAEKGDWPFADAGPERPDLVLLDFGEPATELARDLAWIKANWPLANCLVLADTARQLQAARVAGADGVLLRGFAMGEFFTTLQDLLKGKVCLGFEPALPSSEARGNIPESSASLGGQALLVSPVVF
jgi:DNA-binding NarL/FixJ family response regulator